MGDKIKVLMVDDEKQFRATTKKILNKRGFEVVMAASGKEAIASLPRNPDVVILDVKMPGMDGHQVLKEIKKQIPDLPVIMLTGHGALPSAREALVEGAFDYLAKPCDIDLLAAKIKEAYQHGRTPGFREEKRVMGVMIPIKEYTIVTRETRIKDAIFELKASFSSRLSTSRIMETGHRSILVMDKGENVTGILAITDLLKLVLPTYLSMPKPSMADAISYSPMFWQGMFMQEIKKKANEKVENVMSPAPLTIDGKSSLMEAAYLMLVNNARRMVVELSGQVAGVIREQDLFFEMEKNLRS